MTARFVGIVLAGGRGERLGGVIKANIRIGGVRLIERVAGAFGGAQNLLVAHGAVPPGRLGLTGQIAVPDIDADYGGPLAGLAGALEWCLAQPQMPEIVVTAAVDTPFLPAGFAQAMADALGEADALVSSHGGQDYPTNAAWRVGAIATLPARVRDASAPHSLRRLAAELSAAALDWPAARGGDPFANANTPDDLKALEARATAR